MTNLKIPDNFRLSRISPSMIASYLQCPLEFYYSYVAKIKLPQPQIHLTFGSAIHKALEQLYDKKITPIESFKKAFKKSNLNDDEQHLFEEYTLLGIEMVTNYMAIHPTLDKMYKLSDGKAEKYVRRYLINPITGQQSSIPMSGILDRLTNAGKIIEYKTSKNKWKEDETRFKVQFLMYNLWYYSEHGKLADETLYFILLKKYKKHKRDQVLQVLSAHVTYDDLAEAFDEVELIINKIHSGYFERPTSSYHPNYCNCYAYEKLLNQHG